jgi:hypothetical protein
MMSGTSGPTSYAPFATWDHDLQSWKTSEATCLWALTLSSLTLPPWGGLHDGELSEHPTPERLTNGPDSSSLPTPSANDTTGAEDQAQRRNRNAGGPMLRDLPTLLPTPAVNDMGRGKTVDDWDAWTDRMKEAHGNGNGHGKSLEIEALRLLPTPTTQDGSNTAGPSQSSRHTPPLNTAVIHIGASTAQPSPDGSESSEDRPLHQPRLDGLALPA